MARDLYSVSISVANYDRNFEGTWTCGVSGGAAESNNVISHPQVVAQGSLNLGACNSKYSTHKSENIISTKIP